MAWKIIAQDEQKQKLNEDAALLCQSQREMILGDYEKPKERRNQHLTLI